MFLLSNYKTNIVGVYCLSRKSLFFQWKTKELLLNSSYLKEIVKNPPNTEATVCNKGNSTFWK